MSGVAGGMDNKQQFPLLAHSLCGVQEKRQAGSLYEVKGGFLIWGEGRVYSLYGVMEAKEVA